MSSSENPSHHDTTCARGAQPPPSQTQPIAPPIQLSSVYQVSDLTQIEALYQGEAAGFIYSRDGHPNARQLEAKVAALEGAEAALVCASGMAAESALLLGLLGQGDDVALSEELYGKTSLLVGRELSRFGIGSRSFDATRPETLQMALTPRTRVVFAETLSNPLVRLAAIEGLAEVIQRAGQGAALIIDHTMAPLLCRPLAMGADAVTHSLTKLMGGHSDLLLGLIAGRQPIVERAAAVSSTFGLNGNPFESWLALRGVATLALRSERACANALELAERLAGSPKVRAVHYPGLASHPDHERARRTLVGGFGTIMTIDLGGGEQADALIRALRHVPFAPSFGDTATTLSHPTTTSHRGQSPEERERRGITPGLVRLSIGLENVEDLWDDFAQALRSV
ncbi:MAG: PLP-dependent aspartate aminotransferase family protein [Isosphaeraceae bacterium]